MKHSLHLSTRTQKIDWLRAHPELHNQPFWEIYKALVRAKLVSPKTGAIDLHIRGLVEEAKTPSQIQLSGDLTSRKIVEGKTITATEFQDFMANELRRFVVHLVRQRVVGGNFDTTQTASFTYWKEKFEEFLRNPPLGS